MVKKVITNLDSSKVPGPGCTPVVVLDKINIRESYSLASAKRNT